MTGAVEGEVLREGRERTVGVAKGEVSSGHLPAYMDGVSIMGVEFPRAIADTGSCASIVSKEVLDQLPGGHAGMIKQNEARVDVKSVSGEALVFSGTVELEVSIAGYEFVHLFKVMTGGNVLLLGNDFLASHEAVIMIGVRMEGSSRDKASMMSLKHPSGYRVQCNLVVDNRIAGGAAEARRVALCAATRPVVYAEKEVDVPAFSEVIAWLAVPTSLEDEVVMVSPVSSIDSGIDERLVVAHAICRVMRHKVPVRVVNPSGCALRIAPLAAVAAITMQPDMTRGEGADVGVSGAELWDMFGESVTDLDSEHQERLKEWLHRNCDIFAEHPKAPKASHAVQIEVDTGEAQPVTCRPRRFAKEESEVIDQIVLQLEKDQMIRRSTSPWSSPVVLVKQSGKYRLCCDLRGLNEVARPVAHPTPDIQNSLMMLGTSEDGKPSMYWTTLDLAAAFNQWPMAPDAIEKVSFRTQRGQYEWLRAPFGLATLPAQHARAVSNILGDLDGTVCVVFVDDIVVFSHSIDVHFRRLDLVAERLRAAGLSLGVKNSTRFLRPEVPFLGFRVTRDGIKTDEEKIRAMVELAQPKTAKEVRAFCGMIGYYRAFLPKLAERLAPLTDLLKKHSDIKSQWNSEACLEAVRAVKQDLIAAPILAHPRFDKPFRICCDASSKRGVGFVLEQRDEKGRPRVISYGARKLNPAERKYTVSEQELLAVLEGIKKYRPYIFGRDDTTVVTDHTAIKYLFKMRPQTGGPVGRLHRWCEQLSEWAPYIKIESRPGLVHQNADGLSRCVGPDGVALPVLIDEARQQSIMTEGQNGEESGESSEDEVEEVTSGLDKGVDDVVKGMGPTEQEHCSDETIESEAQSERLCGGGGEDPNTGVDQRQVVKVLMYFRTNEGARAYAWRRRGSQGAKGNLDLPGGRVDPEDANLVGTAMRELSEELRMPRSLANRVQAVICRNGGPHAEMVVTPPQGSQQQKVLVWAVLAGKRELKEVEQAAEGDREVVKAGVYPVDTILNECTYAKAIGMALEAAEGERLDEEERDEVVAAATLNEEIGKDEHDEENARAKEEDHNLTELRKSHDGESSAAGEAGTRSDVSHAGSEGARAGVKEAGLDEDDKEGEMIGKDKGAVIRFLVLDSAKPTHLYTSSPSITLSDVDTIEIPCARERREGTKTPSDLEEGWRRAVGEADLSVEPSGEMLRRMFEEAPGGRSECVHLDSERNVVKTKWHVGEMGKGALEEGVIGSRGETVWRWRTVYEVLDALAWEDPQLANAAELAMIGWFRVRAVRPAYALVACEFSAATTAELTAVGIRACSCDILPTERPELPHYTGNVIDVIDLGWDLIVGHPPCKYSACSALRYVYEDERRYINLQQSADLFRRIFYAKGNHLAAIEQPVTNRHFKAEIGGLKPAGLENTWEHGHNHSKPLTLFLKGLRPLRSTDPKIGRMAKMRRLAPTAERAHLRSRTYGGVARAMARQFALTLYTKLARPMEGSITVPAEAPRKLTDFWSERRKELVDSRCGRVHVCMMLVQEPNQGERRVATMDPEEGVTRLGVSGSQTEEEGTPPEAMLRVTARHVLSTSSIHRCIRNATVGHPRGHAVATGVGPDSGTVVHIWVVPVQDVEAALTTQGEAAVHGGLIQWEEIPGALEKVAASGEARLAEVAHQAVITVLGSPERPAVIAGVLPSSVVSGASLKNKLPDLDEIRAEQRKDPQLERVRKFLEEGAAALTGEAKMDLKTIKDAGYFLISDGLLWHVHRKREDDPEKRRLVIPESLQERVLEGFHTRRGHSGRQETVRAIRAWAWWNNLDEAVIAFIRKCPEFVHMKDPGRRAGTMERPERARMPFEILAADVLGPLGATTDGSRYVLGVVCTFSRFAVAAVFPEAPSSSDVIKMIDDQVVNPLGVPRIIYTDHGTIFTSRETMQYAETLGIEIRAGTAYQHTTAASCERWWHTLEKLIRTCHAKDDFDRMLPQLLSKYHDMTQDTLGGVSPYEVVYGRPRRGEAEVVWGGDAEERSASMGEYLKERLEMARQLRESIEERVEKKAEQNEKTANRKKNPGVTFKVGDRVAVLRPKYRKTESRYFGPVWITKVLDHQNFEVEPIQGGMHNIFHISKLRRFDAEEVEVTEGDTTDRTGQVYRVEKFLDKKREQGKEKIKVLWLGWSRGNASWEPRERLEADGFKEELEEFDREWRERRRRLRGSAKARQERLEVELQEQDKNKACTHTEQREARRARRAADRESRRMGPIVKKTKKPHSRKA